MVRPVVRLSLPPSVPVPPPSSCISGWTGAVGAKPTGRQKLLHLVRHAQGYHNINQDALRDPVCLDARLTPEGISQCQALQRAAASLRPEVVVSSPLTRTLQTAELAFGPQRQAAGAPLLALEGIRETVNFLCDARRPLSAIRADFPTADFSACDGDEDVLWKSYEARFGSQEQYTKHRESAELPALAARARDALRWIGARPEREIVVVGHSAFFWNTFNMGSGVGGASGPGSLPPVFDFGGDRALESWLANGFANAEMRSVIADFDVPGDPAPVSGL